MRKVFWQYPNEFDPIDKWKRLDPNVVKQNRWFQSPFDINHEKFKSTTKNTIEFTPKEKELCKENMKFVRDYKNLHTHDDDISEHDHNNESILDLN